MFEFMKDIENAANEVSVLALEARTQILAERATVLEEARLANEASLAEVRAKLAKVRAKASDTTVIELLSIDEAVTKAKRERDIKRVALRAKAAQQA